MALTFNGSTRTAIITRIAHRHGLTLQHAEEAFDAWMADEDTQFAVMQNAIATARLGGNVVRRVEGHFTADLDAGDFTIPPAPFLADGRLIDDYAVAVADRYDVLLYAAEDGQEVRLNGTPAENLATKVAEHGPHLRWPLIAMRLA